MLAVRRGDRVRAASRASATSRTALPDRRRSHSLLLLVPQFPTTAAGTLRVGAVQGNGPAGYFDERSRNAVLNAQLEATAPLFGEDIDVLLWPEGGIDSDPPRTNRRPRCSTRSRSGSTRR